MEEFHHRADRIATGQPADFSHTDDAGANQHVSLARLRAVFVTNPLDRFWPLTLVLFLASCVYTAWGAAAFNPVGFMLGVHLNIAFGLLAWNDQSRASLMRLFGRV